MQEAGAELVLLGLAVLLDEPVRLERLKQPMDGRAGDSEPVGELADPEPARAAGERTEDPRGAVDGLDRPLVPPASRALCRLVVVVAYSALSNRLR